MARSSAVVSKVEPLTALTVPLQDSGVRMPGGTKLGDLAASALRKAVRHFHANRGHYSQWQMTLYQPAVSFDPRDPSAPAIRGFVRITVSVPKAWQDEIHSSAGVATPRVSAPTRQQAAGSVPHYRSSTRYP